MRPTFGDGACDGRAARLGVRPTLAMALVTAGLGGWFGCGRAMFERGEGLDPGSLPEEVRGDYAVFADRCSKCHSLARPLTSGITTDRFWWMYVQRMRRQPASGIDEADTAPILRFLHWYSGKNAEAPVGD